MEMWWRNWKGAAILPYGEVSLRYSKGKVRHVLASSRRYPVGSSRALAGEAGLSRAP